MVKRDQLTQDQTLYHGQKIEDQSQLKLINLKLLKDPRE